jgi:hypothetical protein
MEPATETQKPQEDKSTPGATVVPEPQQDKATPGGPAAPEQHGPPAEARAPAKPEEAAKPVPPTLFQPSSLVRTCEAYLSRRTEILAQRRYKGAVLPLECFLRILRYIPTGNLAPERMHKIVQNMPALDCPEVDEAYWRLVVTQSTDTPIAAPYGVLVEQTRAQKQVSSHAAGLSLPLHEPLGASNHAIHGARPRPPAQLTHMPRPPRMPGPGRLAGAAEHQAAGGGARGGAQDTQRAYGSHHQYHPPHSERPKTRRSLTKARNRNAGAQAAGGVARAVVRHGGGARH